MLKIVTILLLLSIACYGQGRGSSFSGSASEEYDYEKSLGLVAAYRANKGVILGNTSSVVAWVDLTGNGYNLHQHEITNTPNYYASYSTNNFPAIFFETNNGVTIRTVHMKCDSLAPLFSGAGNKPFSIVGCVNGHFASAGSAAAAFAWTSASNSNASVIGLRPNGSTAAQQGIARTSNTNQVFTTSNLSARGTNVYSIVGGTYDSSGQGRPYANLVSGTLTSFNSGDLTVNTFTVGLSRATNGNYANFWRGAITELQIYTNSITGTDMTNVQRRVNARFTCF
jgi:hypothetical protein